MNLGFSTHSLKNKVTKHFLSKSFDFLDEKWAILATLLLVKQATYSFFSSKRIIIHFSRETASELRLEIMKKKENATTRKREGERKRGEEMESNLSDEENEQNQNIMSAISTNIRKSINHEHRFVAQTFFVQSRQFDCEKLCVCRVCN